MPANAASKPSIDYAVMLGIEQKLHLSVHVFPHCTSLQHCFLKNPITLLCAPLLSMPSTYCGDLAALFSNHASCSPAPVHVCIGDLRPPRLLAA